MYDLINFCEIPLLSVFRAANKILLAPQNTVFSIQQQYEADLLSFIFTFRFRHFVFLSFNIDSLFAKWKLDYNVPIKRTCEK